MLHYSKFSKFKMRLIIAFISFPLILTAQNDIETLFGGDNRAGVYGAFETKFSQIDKGLGLFLGGRAGMIFNSTISVGAAGYGLIPTSKIDIDCLVLEHKNLKNSYLEGFYGGLLLEYINSSNKLLHFTANTLVGFVGVKLCHDDDFDRDNFDHRHNFSFVIEPEVAAELNVSKYFRIALGISYRYSPNFKLSYGGETLVPTTYFNGLSANLTFKVGGF